VLPKIIFLHNFKLFDNSDFERCEQYVSHLVSGRTFSSKFSMDYPQYQGAYSYLANTSLAFMYLCLTSLGNKTNGVLRYPCFLYGYLNIFFTALILNFYLANTSLAVTFLCLPSYGNKTNGVLRYPCLLYGYLTR